MGWRDEETKVHSEVSGLPEDIRGSGTQELQQIWGNQKQFGCPPTMDWLSTFCASL